jgi:ribosomal protein L37E
VVTEVVSGVWGFNNGGELMKICDKCGERNYFKPGDEIECKGCGYKFSSHLADVYVSRHDEINQGQRKLQHDEYGWER